MSKTQVLYIALAVLSLVAGGIGSAIALHVAMAPATVVPVLYVVMFLCFGISMGLAPFVKKEFPDVTVPTFSIPAAKGIEAAPVPPVAPVTPPAVEPAPAPASPTAPSA